MNQREDGGSALNTASEVSVHRVPFPGTTAIGKLKHTPPLLTRAAP